MKHSVWIAPTHYRVFSYFIFLKSDPILYSFKNVPHEFWSNSFTYRIDNVWFNSKLIFFNDGATKDGNVPGRLAAFPIIYWVAIRGFTLMRQIIEQRLVAPTVCLSDDFGEILPIAMTSYVIHAHFRIISEPGFNMGTDQHQNQILFRDSVLV